MPGEPCRARESSGAFDGDAESVGGRGRVGFGGVLCALESGDSRRSPRAAAKPPLRCPVKHARGSWMGTRSPWEAKAGVGFGGVLCALESGDAKRPRRATPEALGLRRESPLSIRRGAPCLGNLVERVSPLGRLDGNVESLGGQGGVGFGGVLCALESGDSRRSPRAAAKPPLRCPVEHRRSLSRRGAPCVREAVRAPHCVSMEIA